MLIHLPDGHTATPAEVFTPGRFDAVLFDLDGVLTSTARVHAACWKQMFDDFLRSRSHRTGEPFRPFDLDTDYKQYVDGKPRDEGVRSFLASRGITCPKGRRFPARRGVGARLGERKDELVEQAIHAARSSATRVRLRSSDGSGDGLKTAVVSSSRQRADVLGRPASRTCSTPGRRNTESIVDLPGKPAPDTYLHAAQLLGVAPSRAVVVEDALAGVAAGRAGGLRPGHRRRPRRRAEALRRARRRRRRDRPGRAARQRAEGGR